MPLFTTHQKKSVFFILIFALSITLIFNACSDFAMIFKHGRHASSKSKRGKQIAGRKTRGGEGKVVKGVFLWPLVGEVSSPFGERDGRPHDGIDIRADRGMPVKASAEGEVVFSGKFHGYGNLILLKHSNQYYTAYAHNDENLVKEGAKVSQGEVVSKVGNTGNATGYHLHFEIRYKSTPMDPLQFLPESEAVF